MCIRKFSAINVAHRCSSVDHRSTIPAVSTIRSIRPAAAKDIGHLRLVRTTSTQFNFVYRRRNLFLVTGVGDPHIDTIDNGRYTCHIQGLYIFAQTSTAANQTAQANLNNGNAFDTNLLYPDDLFYMHVRSASIPPALPYVERMQGSASVFSSYIIGAGNYTFVISNRDGKFGKTNTLNNDPISPYLFQALRPTIIYVIYR